MSDPDSKLKTQHSKLAALPVGERTLVMGILKMTPDSFSGDGLDGNLDAAVAQAQAMRAAGADILDVGGMSTRPGSEEISEAEELRRVVPLIARLVAEVDLPVSVDTYRAAVAAAALDAGAVIVNDVSALRADPRMTAVVAGTEAGVVLIAGTGSIAMGINEAGAVERSGGWGPTLGDEGSGYDIARQALKAVAASFDGRAPRTALTERLCRQPALRRPRPLADVGRGRPDRHPALRIELQPRLGAAGRLHPLHHHGQALSLPSALPIQGLGHLTSSSECRGR